MTFLSDSVKNEGTFKTKKTKKRSLKKSASSFLMSCAFAFCVCARCATNRALYNDDV
jgi:hypothetical protein